jgi:hypothetical protein
VLRRVHRAPWALPIATLSLARGSEA